MCHPGDIFRHHQNPDLPRRVGLCTTAKEHLGSTVAFPHLATAFWPDRTNGPRHPTDKCLRTRGAHPFQTRPLDCLQVVPVRQPAFGVPPSEGRAPHDRQETPCPTVAFPPVGHRLLLNRIAWSSSVRPQFKALRLSSTLFLRPLTPARSTADDALRGKSTS